MQYLVNVIDSRSNSGTEEEAVAIDAFNDKLRAGGHWVFAGGLADPSVSTVIDGRGDEPVFTDGPFVYQLYGGWLAKKVRRDQVIAAARELYARVR